MRQVLRLVGNRYGAALTLLVVIAVVVGFGKLVGGSRNSPDVSAGHRGPASTGATAPSGSASAQPDDGDLASAGPEMSIVPSPSAGAAGPQAVATDFAKAWLNHHGISAANWHKAIAKYATKALADRMDGVDPGSVPADQTTGPPTIADQGDGYAEVQVPTDQGILVLRLVVQGGRWLVDGVDWQQS